MSAELQEPSALPAALRLPRGMSTALLEAVQELHADPWFAVWLAGNILGFLVVVWLLATS